MKKYIAPKVDTLQAQARQMVCNSPTISITRDSDKEVTTSWVRQQALWAEEEDF